MGLASTARALLALCWLGLAAGCGGGQENGGVATIAPADLALFELDGSAVYPLREPVAEFVLFLFTRTDCPISNRYAPEVKRLMQRFGPLGVELVLVYPNATQTSAAIREHLVDFEYSCRQLRDPHHDLVRLADASVTPEAALFDRKGELRYAGRIDDRFTDFGKARQEPNSRDLENALVAVTSNGRVPVLRTQAVGCFLSDLAMEKRESADL
jgi:hypothetical protein